MSNGPKARLLNEQRHFNTEFVSYWRGLVVEIHFEYEKKDQKGTLAAIACSVKTHNICDKRSPSMMLRDA